MAFGNGPKIVTSGLVLCLDASDTNSYTSGSTSWYDLAGSNTGTLTNGPTFDSGNGGSIVFDGTNDYVNGTITSAISSITTDITVSVWVYNKEWKESDFIEGGAAGFVFWTTSNYYDKKRLIWGKQSGIQTISNGDFSTRINTWYNVVGTIGGGYLKLYYNGYLDRSDTGSPILSNTTYTIGTGIDGFMNGYVSNVQVYNRELSAAEILQNFNAQRTRFKI